MHLKRAFHNLQPTHFAKYVNFNGLSSAGPDNLDNLKKLAEQFQKQVGIAGEGAATAAQEDDDEVPELVEGETFEAAAEEGQKS